MIARCKQNLVSALPASDLIHVQRRVRSNEVNLQVGAEYLVLGVGWNDGHSWLLVAEEKADDYPKPHYAGFFELLDDRIPANWSLRLESGNLGSSSLLPEPWALDPSFLEKLVDEVPDAIVLFASIKRDLLRWHNRDRITTRR